MLPLASIDVLVVVIGMASSYLFVNIALRVLEHYTGRPTVHRAHELDPLVAWSHLPDGSALGGWHLQLEKADMRTVTKRLSRAA